MREYFEKIYSGSKVEFYESIENTLRNNKKMFIVTANPETVMIAQKDRQLNKTLLDMQTTIVADGIGIKKGAQILKYEVKDTIPGIEICLELLTYCNKLSKSIFLLGAQEEVLQQLVNMIKVKYPNIVIVGYKNGYVDNRQESIKEAVNLEPDVVLVALGIPAQEILIYENLNRFKKGIFIGVGGTFDVLSGMKRRAPKVFRNLHLEWLYRILREPKRIKRFLENNVMFIFKVLKER